MTTRKSLLCIILGAFTLSCVDPYVPTIDVNKERYLVIEGFINTTSNLATVRISQVLNLSDTVQYPPVSEAQVFIQDENGISNQLVEQESGVYTKSSVFDPNKKYKLTVSALNKEYSSSIISIKSTPPIDSLNWEADDVDMSINVSNHNDQQGAKYYKFNYVETIEYTSIFNALYKFENGIVNYREAGEGIYRCWVSRNSTSTLLASTENLSQNIIGNHPIIKIKKGDRRLWHAYSVLVQQVSLDRDAYIYWSQLKTITESQGGLFDPIPFHLKGNITCTTDSGEIVLGYFSGGEVQEERLTIKNNQLPDQYFGFRTDDDCFEEYIVVASVGSLVGRKILITNRLQNENGVTLGYFFTEEDCADCRMEGGSTVKPDFMN